MSGPCMCGDTMCPSCGPAQGYNPQFERVCEWLEDGLLADLDPSISLEWLVEELANRLGKCSPALVQAVEAEAYWWAGEKKKKTTRLSAKVVMDGNQDWCPAAPEEEQ